MCFVQVVRELQVLLSAEQAGAAAGSHSRRSSFGLGAASVASSTAGSTAGSVLGTDAAALKGNKPTTGQPPLLAPVDGRSLAGGPKNCGCVIS